MCNIVTTPLLFASLFTFVYSCCVKNLYRHFISFGLLYYLLHSHVFVHCHRCFSFSIFTLPAAELCMTLYDSLFTVLYSAPAHSFSSCILLPSTPFCACTSLPFLPFTYQSSTHSSLHLIHSLLHLIHVLLVYSIVYVYLV